MSKLRDSSTNLQMWSAARGRWEVLISLTFELLMLSNSLENFLIFSNCVQFIVFHLIYLGLHHFLTFFFSLEGYGSRSDWSFDFLWYRKRCLLALLQDEIQYPLLKYMVFGMMDYWVILIYILFLFTAILTETIFPSLYSPFRTHMSYIICYTTSFMFIEFFIVNLGWKGKKDEGGRSSKFPNHALFIYDLFSLHVSNVFNLNMHPYGNYLYMSFPFFPTKYACNSY